MRRTKLGTIVAVIAAVLLSWAANADAKPDGDKCNGGSGNAAHCDLDGDGIVNKADDDIDGDGVTNDAEPCPRDPTDQCETEEPGPDPTGGLPGLDDLPPVEPPSDLPGLEDLPPVEPPSDLPSMEPPTDVPPDGVPPELPPVEVPPVTPPTLPDVPPVPTVA